MSDMSMENLSGGEHAWVHENLGAYLAGGLSAEERGRLDGHVNGCAECFDAFTEARDADRAAQRALAGLVPSGEGSAFEDRVITFTRETTMNRWKHPMVRRAAYATAAAVALAATGVFANIAMHQGGRFNNPMSQALAAKADDADGRFDSGKWIVQREQASVASNLRGIAQSANGYAGDWHGSDLSNGWDKSVTANMPEDARKIVEDSEKELLATKGRILLDRMANPSSVVGKGDALDISVFELVTPGLPFQKTQVVDENGNIELQNVGNVHVAGLTPGQIQEKIGEVATSKGFLLRAGNSSPAPQVSVQLALRDADDMGFEFGSRDLSKRRLYAPSTQAADADRASVTASREPLAMRRSNVADLVTDAQKLSDSKKFNEAADLLQQAVIVDPNNAEAKKALKETLPKVSDRLAADIQQRLGQQVAYGDDHEEFARGSGFNFNGGTLKASGGAAATMPASSAAGKDFFARGLEGPVNLNGGTLTAGS
ncbi:MAG TPA: polysaccharide biosynthesis/export family protein, partial [Phycisphaerae bacterium]|nr:polysaccharide biosynthesis/export family protein [Phycisphaerae bacterium]